MKNKKIRFACQILFYDCDQFILRTIENCAPHVEKIFITYSPLPWGYNPEARDKYRNPSDPSILEQSKHLDQIELIEGDWLTEEAQRNEVLDRAKAEGFDYLIVQDADEFYTYEGYKKNIAAIKRFPDVAFYKTPWYQFWKSTNYVLVCRYSELLRNRKLIRRLENTKISYSMAFAINLNMEISFDRCRRPTQEKLNNYCVLPGVCYHLSYVMSDTQVERKISTYGHSQQIDRAYWFKHKWRGWRPRSRNLHPIQGSDWIKAVRYDGELPAEVRDLKQLEQHQLELNWVERAFEWRKDLQRGIYGLLKRASAKLKRYLSW